MKLRTILIFLVFCLLAPKVFGQETTSPTSPKPEDKPGASPVGGPPAESAPTCMVPQAPVEIHCEEGGEFLCVDTPPGGVADPKITLTGRINESLGALGHLEIRLQHDYTKKTEQIIPEKPLGEKGIFSIIVLLPDLGPYTISIFASPLNGTPQQKIVHTSFVSPLALTEDSISVVTEEQYVKVNLDLLKGCDSFCDFIGSSTGGVEIRVLNQVQTPTGVTRSIECKTTVMQGKPGQYSIGVPQFNGANQISVTACNAANRTKGDCPTFGPLPLTAAVDEGAIHILEPADSASPYFSRSAFPQLRLQFKVDGVSAPEPCTDQVTISLNTKEPVALCPDANGTYGTSLQPEEGYNFALITYQDGNKRLQKVYSFGWGDLQSPKQQVTNGFEAWFSKDFLNRTVVPFLNNFLQSDSIGRWLTELTDSIGRGKQAASAKEDLSLKKEILKNLKYCGQGGGGLSDYRFKFVETPQFKTLKITKAEFHENSLELPMRMTGFSTAVQFYLDKNKDGVPDEDPIPLKIAFQSADLHLMLVKKTFGQKDFWILSSPYTDCAYKDNAYCNHMPAQLIPENFVGGATKIGGFVVCDPRQGVSPAMKDKCQSVNEFNMQTGLVNEKVLDALNEMVACSMSATIAANAISGFAWNKIHVSWEDSSITENGVNLKTDWAFRGLSDPIITKADGDISIATKPKKGIATLLRMDLLNRIFQTIETKFTYGPDLLKQMKFDFVKECDEKKAEGATQLNPLCNIVPRVQELLGTPLSENHYFDPKQPLQLAIEPSQELPLEIHLTDLAESQKGVTIRFGNWKGSIFALKTDESQPKDKFGNPVLLRDANGGAIAEETPIIQVRVGLYLQAQVKGPFVSPDDPSSWFFSVRLVPDGSRWFVTPIDESNTTVISGSNLVANLKEKLDFALNHFSQEENTLKFPISKSFSLSKPLFGDDSWLARLGLQEIQFGADGLQLELNTANDFLQGLLDPLVQQLVTINGTPTQFSVP